ncbi:hypothetical protein M758_1G294400 [Ceratodon purpureus]|nr:hypothetical protein M758_1G294400 [Ceratodon purpureus]
MSLKHHQIPDKPIFIILLAALARSCVKLTNIFQLGRVLNFLSTSHNTHWAAKILTVRHLSVTDKSLRNMFSVILARLHCILGHQTASLCTLRKIAFED